MIDTVTALAETDSVLCCQCPCTRGMIQTPASTLDRSDLLKSGISAVQYNKKAFEARVGPDLILRSHLVK